ncbi:MAG: hypothetical protein QXH32_09070 [Candidatus Caldarchaeum sp.]
MENSKAEITFYNMNQVLTAAQKKIQPLEEAYNKAWRRINKLRASPLGIVEYAKTWTAVG